MHQLMAKTLDIVIAEIRSMQHNARSHLLSELIHIVDSMFNHKEEGTTTTPFDMVVRNDMDRFHLVMDVIDRVPKLQYVAGKWMKLQHDRW